MSVRQRIKSTAIFKGLLAGFIFISAASFAAEKTEIKVGVIDSFNPEFSTQTLEPTLKFLSSKLPAYRFVPVSLNSVNPDKELKNNPVDFLISSAGTFHELSLSQGIVHVATRKTILSDDPSASEAGAFVTLAKREDLKELRDLKEKVVAASQPNSFDGWLVAQHEIFKNGLDPENFFKRSVFTHFQFPDSLMLLIQGEADVAILSACVLEQLSNEGLIEASDFKVLAQKPQGVLRCARSTDLYPGIVFAAREDIPPKLKWEVTSALMSMPPTNDYEWTIASRFSKVDELYRDLQLGPYQYLKDWSPAGILKRFKTEILLASGLLLLLILNSLYLRRTVAKRTLQVRRTLNRQIKLEKEYKESRNRLAQMEKFGVINQMSGMLAHEVQQPLMAINNYLAGLRVYLNSKGYSDAVTERAIGSLEHNSERIGSIVTRVRGYAKQKKDEMKSCDLTAIALSALNVLKALKFEHVEVTSDLPPQAKVVGDPLELELLIINLLKNACSAVEKQPKPKVDLKIESLDDKHWCLSVSDNGPTLDDKSFARLKTLGDSVKPEGMGIGLSIVRGIADKHGAELEFIRLPKGGICSRAVIDKEV